LSRFALRPSPRLAFAMALAHAAAAAGAWISVPAWPGGALAFALLALGAISIGSRALLRGADAVRALEIGPAGVRLELASGESLDAEIAGRRYVSRWLVLLPVLRPARRTILVTADMLSEEAFRVLRLWALWGRLPGPAERPSAPASAVH
jgi:hypothetical protein